MRQKLGSYAQVQWFCNLVTLPMLVLGLMLVSGVLDSRIANAQSDDVTLGTPKAVTNTIAKWRPSGFAVDFRAKIVVVTAHGVAADGTDLNGTGSQVIVGKDKSEVKGYATNKAGIAKACALTFSTVVTRTAGKPTVDIKTAIMTCLDK